MIFINHTLVIMQTHKEERVIVDNIFHNSGIFTDHTTRVNIFNHINTARLQIRIEIGQRLKLTLKVVTAVVNNYIKIHV